MTTSDRDTLALQQEQALQAVLRKGTAPAGMDPVQVERTAGVLQSKRRHEAANGAPVLHDMLGNDFARHFDVYAAAHGYPNRGGPVADAAAFGDYLRKQGLLPEFAGFEHLRLRTMTGRRLQFRRIGSKWVLMFRFRGRVREWRIPASRRIFW